MSLPYFPMFPTDFEAKTSHLTLEEDGAYNRLLRLMWMTPGCSLPDDNAWIRRRMRVDQDTFDRVVLVVIDEFCARENGRVSNAKLTRVFEDSSERHEKRKNAGAKGGKAKALNSNNSASSNAVAKPKQPKPKPKPDIREEPKGSLCGFDDFWGFWPSKIGKDDARKAWRKLSIDLRREAFVAVRAGWFDRWQNAHPDANPIHASTFMNKKRWQDEFPTPQLKAITGDRYDQPPSKSAVKQSAFVGGAAATS